MAEHIVPRKIYVSVLIALMALLLLTTAVAFIDFDAFMPGRGWSTGIALAIAITKAVLIILFFMHVKYGTKLVWVAVCSGFVWLGIFLVLSMGDYMSRNSPPGANSRGEPRNLVEAPSQPATGGAHPYRATKFGL